MMMVVIFKVFIIHVITLFLCRGFDQAAVKNFYSIMYSCKATCFFIMDYFLN